MSDQNARPRRPHNAKDEDTISTESKVPSKPIDLEKGEIQAQSYSSGEGKGPFKAQSDLTLVRNNTDNDKKSGAVKHRILRKHWRPGWRWFMLVFLGLGACWIPAILAWTKFPGAKVWGVELLFWSIWLSILWAGWWFALVFSWVWHRILLIFVHWFRFYKLKRYVNWLEYLHGYLALVAWTAALWITWVPLIAERQRSNSTEQTASSRSVRAVNLGGRLCFAFTCCAIILFAEKISVQFIAMKFHERSYRRRIDAQKEAVKVFKVLFALVRGSFTLSEKRGTSRKGSSLLVRSWSSSMYLGLSPQQFNYHHRIVDRAPTSTLQTAFTDVTGQIFGASDVAEDDVVGKAFHRDGSRKMKQLADDIWRGFSANVENSQTTNPFALQKKLIQEKLSDKSITLPKGCEDMTVDRIWNIITGGLPQIVSVSEAGFTMRSSDLHAEQRRLEETMNDLQNVVGRLDDLFMLFWVVGAMLIFAVALEAELKTLIFGAGSAFVGASWLLRDAAAEVLSSVIFLFSKHPFDVEDKVIINGKSYTVVEMRLLSTVFYDDDSVQVQAPNSLLNTMFIHNLRRSPATSEAFKIEVSDQTTNAQLEEFKVEMIAFLKAHPKDYREDFEVVIKELSFQTQNMVLSMEIKYNNNWESNAQVRAQRRNTWICQVRDSLRRANIQGSVVPPPPPPGAAR